jgi:hypothetical protein
LGFFISDNYLYIISLERGAASVCSFIPFPLSLPVFARFTGQASAGGHWLHVPHVSDSVTVSGPVHAAAGQAAKEQTGSVFEAVRAKQMAESREHA